MDSPNIDTVLFKHIKILISDVDGVLTDGGLYYSAAGVSFKRFNVKDGMAVKLLREANIKCGVISSDKSEIVKVRAEALKMDYVFIGVWDKKEAAENICNELGLTLNNLAFIGDDVNDIPLLQAAGFSACPSDAVSDVKKITNYVSGISGGNGVFREVAEMILNAG